jgi:hypothetical protein
MESTGVIAAEPDWNQREGETIRQTEQLLQQGLQAVLERVQ